MTFMSVKAAFQNLLGFYPSVKAIALMRRWYPSNSVIERVAWHAGEGIRDKQKLRTYQAKPGFFLTHDLSDHILRHVYLGGDYEPEVTRLLESIAQPGQVWWDIGANVGWFTFLLSKQVGVTGRVVAFEPNPKVANWLKMAKQKNNSSNVDIQVTGLSNQEGRSEFFVPTQTNEVLGGHGRPSLVKHEDIECREHETVIIETSTIDRLVSNGMAVPYGIKIDVEGWESAVFKGAANLFRNNPPALIVSEVNHFPRCLCKPEELVLQLVDLGYLPWHVETLKKYTPGDLIDGRVYKDFLFIHQDYPDVLQRFEAA
jgi:FkbM family methyltransferase